MELSHIAIRGAREHNLKRVDVEIPKKKLVVLTGVSGSGKSSLAFDTLYAEGQRRYVESLSAYARQFLGQMDKPQYDTIRGLTPTIAIQQKTAGSNPRSTVATITEIADYLRVLYARIGKQHCHQCGKPVGGQSAVQIASELEAVAKSQKVVLLSPLLVNRKGEHRELLEEARRGGFVRLRIDGQIVLSEAVEALDKRKKHHVEAVVDRLVPGKVEQSRLVDSVELALKIGKGELIANIEGKDRVYSRHLACHRCGLSFPELSPQSFSFNSPQGMCPECNGLGTKLAIDPKLVIPDESLTIDAGAILSWGPDVSKKTGWAHGFRGQLIKHLGISATSPIRKLSKKKKQILLWGTGDKRYQVRWEGKSGQGSFQVTWEGLVPRLMRRFAQTQSERAKRWYGQFMAQTSCQTCKGSRMRPESRYVLIGGVGLSELSELTILDVERQLNQLKLSATDRAIAAELLKEILGRLGFLRSVGLGYLSLDRSGPSLSGGESQRIRLASQVGSELTGVTYVLDEPSIGLHQRDNERLIATLERMRDIGNTVVVVEHDEETIRAADHVIDFGPGAGVGGGSIVFEGTPKALLTSKQSLTGRYLSGNERVTSEFARRVSTSNLRVVGARENNLKSLDVCVPLETLSVVTGVSGAGKSTLVNDILYPTLARRFHGYSGRLGRCDRIEGMAALDKVINIDQKPIGRTPRSNPATYIKVFDEIRRLFAGLPDARAKGYSPGRFSFNVKGGRCEACEGDGVRKIEMHFLADVYVRCDECQGHRFNETTLDIRYRGKSIADVLDLTVEEAHRLFANVPKIAEPLGLLREVGLDYLKVGQPSPTLSGGEAQRIKLARELSRKATGKTLYILDEPTTGLHFHDVKRLLAVLEKLVDAGNTVVVIEHNLDVIVAADHVIDLGPEGGPGGGHLVAQGSPEEVASHKGSFTGQYIKQWFAQHRKRPAKKKSGKVAKSRVTSSRAAARTRQGA